MAPSLIDLSGLIPVTQSNVILQDAVQASAALSLGTRMPMGTAVSEMPVAGAFPRAAWTGADGRKPFTDLDFEGLTIKAEEVAAVVAVPDKYLEDSSINLWAFARPRLAEAIGAALDDAALWGVGAPASFPTGGVVGRAVQVDSGTDAADTVNLAMGAVEVQGVPVTGSAADIAVKGALRGMRDNTGAILLGTDQVAQRQVSTLYGTPISYIPFPIEEAPEGDFITGNWASLIIGVRQDIRYQFSKDGVIVDGNGRVVISAFQDNVTLLKVWARFGCVIAQPPTRRVKNPQPFAVATVAPVAQGRLNVAAAATATRSTSKAKAAAADKVEE